MSGLTADSGEALVFLSSPSNGTIEYTFFDPIDKFFLHLRKNGDMSSMSIEIKVDGACYCGEVTINGTVSADKIMACHCTDCQKFSGAPFRAVAMISAEQVAISGAV